jgi:pimeloyl-ACP methyl ester carboxylesterase
VIVVGAGGRTVAGSLSRGLAVAASDLLPLVLPRPAGLQCDVLWLVMPGDAAATRGWLDALPELGARELNLVVGAATAPAAVVREIEDHCRRLGVGHRGFRLAAVLGAPAPDATDADDDPDGLWPVLAALHAFKREIDDRLAEYFDYQALRCAVPGDARLNVIHADDAAELMRRIARRADTRARWFDIAAPHDLALGALWERIGLAYGVSLLTTDDRRELNAVDRLFELRLTGLDGLLADPGFAPEAAYAAAEFAPDAGWLDDGGVIAQIRARQDAAREATDARDAALLGSLAATTIEVGAGPLRYVAAGDGDPPIVILNAVGHGLAYWQRLVPRLAGRRRVLLWEPRDAPGPSTIRDQVDDIEAVLAAERIARCHLAGWCTGPKVAVELYLRRPAAVASMAFLNATFKCTGGPPELDSPYEQSFEPILRALERRRSLASTLMTSLRARWQDDPRELLEAGDADQLAERALTGMNRDLRAHVVAPFASAASTLRYLDEIVDFWSYDTRARAPEVRVPVLLVTAERDTVASPAASRTAARLFPDARCVELRGATHYCLYDRPVLVGELLDRFFADPARRGGLGRDVEIVA